MNLKIITLSIFLAFSLLGIQGKVYAQSTNAGFVPDNIWYSKDPFTENDKIKIYTLVFNPDKKELSGTVIFLDKDVVLGKKNFVLAPQTVKDISIEWTATPGTHSIFAKIEDAKFLISKGKYENADLIEKETAKSVRTAKKKTETKTNANNKDSDEKTSNDTEDASELSMSIVDTIKENTPNFIAKPASKVTEMLENLRVNTGNSLQEKKEEAKNELEALKKESKKSSSSEKNNILLKPFKYLEFFVLAFLSFIVNNIWIFYIALVLAVFYVLRYIYRKILW